MKRTAINPWPTTLFLLLAMLLAPVRVLAYGEGGGGGSISDSNPIKSWTKQELMVIFHHVQPEDRAVLVETFHGAPISKHDLLRIRQGFFEREMAEANQEAQIQEALVLTLEFLDQTGQVTQTVLGFVPGLGWVSMALDTARAGANTYRDGGSTADVFQSMAVEGTVGVVMDEFSPIDADQAFNQARVATNIFRTTTKKSIKFKAAKVGSRNLGRYIADKQVESEISNMGKQVLSHTIDAVRRQSPPNRISRPDYKPGQQTVPDPQAGLPPDQRMVPQNEDGLPQQ